MKLKSKYWMYLFVGFIVLILLSRIILINREDFNLQNLRQLLTNNLNRNVVTVMKIPPEQIKTEDCALKCDAKSCNMMEEMKKNLTKCIECHKNPKKCFHKSIVGGNCDDCVEGEEQINCSDTRNYGCSPPHNIQSYDGTLPYYIQIPDDNLNSPFDKKCVFCWELNEYI